MLCKQFLFVSSVHSDARSPLGTSTDLVASCLEGVPMAPVSAKACWKKALGAHLSTLSTPLAPYSSAAGSRCTNRRCRIVRLRRLRNRFLAAPLYQGIGPSSEKLCCRSCLLHALSSTQTRPAWEVASMPVLAAQTQTAAIRDYIPWLHGRLHAS